MNFKRCRAPKENGEGVVFAFVRSHENAFCKSLTGQETKREPQVRIISGFDEIKVTAAR